MDQDILKDRSIAEFIDPDGLFAKKLDQKIKGQYPKDLIIKFGVDPTRPDIHLGHAVVFRFLKKMQDLGCKVVFLVGDFTARIGDPTGKSKVRPEIDQKEIEDNMRTYLEQVGKVLRTENHVFSWIRNSDWFVGVSDIFLENIRVNLPPPLIGEVAGNSFLGKAIVYENSRMQKTHLKKEGIIGITLATFLWTLKNITHQQLISRDMFQERIKSGQELYTHELMYPVLQAIDSFVLSQIYGSCDLEIGGTDQTFNMLMGREVMKVNGLEPQSVISCKILRGLDGKEKMSKSLNNYIAINETPSDIFGKTMSIPDNLIPEYLDLCTDFSQEQINSLITDLDSGKNPKEIKMKLAREIVRIYFDELKADSALVMFENVFSKKGFMENANIVEASFEAKVADVLVANKIIESKSEFRRLIEAGAITDYPDKKITDPNNLVGKTERKIKIGKKIFVVIKPI